MLSAIAFLFSTSVYALAEDGPDTTRRFESGRVTGKIVESKSPSGGAISTRQKKVMNRETEREAFTDRPERVRAPSGVGHWTFRMYRNDRLNDRYFLGIRACEKSCVVIGMR